MSKASGKNISVYVSSELLDLMDRLDNVNWSKIAQDAFQKYAIEILSLNEKDPIVPAHILERLKKERNLEFEKGKQHAKEVLESVDYETLDWVFTAPYGGFYEKCLDRGLLEGDETEGFLVGFDKVIKSTWDRVKK